MSFAAPLRPPPARLAAPLAALVLAALAAGPAAAQTLVHGDGDPARYDIVFLGDGFTAAEQARYAAKVAAAAKVLLATDVYRDFKGGINVWRVDTVSRESGIDNPRTGVTRDTAFDLSYNVGGVQSCIGATTSAGAAAIFREAGRAPGRDATIVLANATEWGGCAFDGYGTSSIPSDFERTVAHELGHRVAGLADEYETGGSAAYGGGEPPFPNCTAALAPLKWRALAAPGVPLPTPETPTNAGKVGAFEGCRYHKTGIYHPALQCKMRDTRAPFCPVCAARLREVLGRFLPGSRDLAVTALGATIAGANLALTATVCNRGRAASGGFDVAFWLHRAGAPTCADVAGADLIATLPALAAGGCAPLTFSAPLPAGMPAFTYRSWLLADSGCALAEPSERDNARAADHVALTDIAARGFGATVSGRDVTLGGRVCVTGRPLALPVRLSLWVNPAGQPLPCATDALIEATLPPPAPGTCTPVSLDATGVAPGRYTLWFRAAATPCLKLEQPGTVADNDARVTFTVR